MAEGITRCDKGCVLLCSLSSYKAINVIMSVPPSEPHNPHYLPKTLPPNSIIICIWEVSFQYRNFGATHSSHNREKIQGISNAYLEGGKLGSMG
jgi:hypothetical protein